MNGGIVRHGPLRQHAATAAVRRLLPAGGLILLAGAVQALTVGGKVVDADGNPLPFVKVRVTAPHATPYSVTVFSTADGSFEAHYARAAAAGLDLDAARIGWKETARSIRQNGGGIVVDFTMHRIANVADQVPASAWLKGDPDSMAYQMTTLHCSNCHQLGADRVRRFSSTLADQPVGDRSEAWVQRAADDLAGPTAANPSAGGTSRVPAHGRIAGWEAIVQYMRLATMQLGEKHALRWGLKEGSPYYNALLQPETSLFSPRDMAVIIPNLAHNYPVTFDSYTDYDDLQRLGEYAVTKQTSIEEFVLPTFGWTREVAIAPGSPKVWFVETDKDRLGALDPADGSVKWYPIPGNRQQGPHTMNVDAEGRIWLALEDSFNVGRFDTKTEQWRLYPPPAGTVFGVTHDFAFNSDRKVEADAKGRIWLTDLGKNELWGVNVETGDIKTYRLPLVPGESHFHSLLYGSAIDAPHHRVWWAQLYGDAGSFDTERDIAERVVPFKRGEGPRRLALQEDGTLWIPLFGAGQLAKIDGETGLELARYTIPDRGAGPYGITYDKRRNAIWAATCALLPLR